jgi:hypothetical protein
METRHFDYSTAATLKAEIEKTHDAEKLAQAYGDEQRADAIRLRRARLTVDLEAVANRETVERIVRPHNHIKKAEGGDLVTLDAAELAHPAVVEATWSFAERDQALARFAKLHERQAPVFVWKANESEQIRQLADQAHVDRQKAAAAAARREDEQLANAGRKREVLAEQERKNFPVGRGGGDQ